ncbi:MAG: beta-propeller domain-containing protein [Candidatus Marithrix sp.]
MLVLRSLLYGMILLSFSAQALQLNLESTDTNTQIMISNDQNLDGVDIYLVWFNLDSNEFKSLMSSSKWKKGLASVYPNAIDIKPFAAFKAADFDESCPENQRCFLALIAVGADENPINTNLWQASTLLPLSLTASRERLPGQQFFLPNDYVNNYRVSKDDIDMVADDSVEPSNLNESVAPESDGTSTTQIEKPDIFRLVGDKLLYANEAAKRFQVIDVSDVSNPSLIGSIALSGNPKELYVIDDYYILLQIDYNSNYNEATTKLIVLQQGAGNSLNIIDEMTISGRFIESRRRGNYIYSVSEQYDSDNEICEVCATAYFANRNNLSINVLELKSTGKLEAVDEAKILGYSPQIAIFSDNLVIANHNPEEEKWQTTQIQVFDLTQSDPLVELPLIKVPGQVPSEFHLSVLNQQLRVVYGPEDRTDGSTLAIYNLTPEQVTLAGQVDKIAPGEGLFATRFVDDRAFVVTYERTDPLWVIDLSDSSNPTILGELIIPGWSEKLFFHEDRLFAVGMDDQVKENEDIKRARRVAVSLFNVEDPTKPTLINRITPLVNQVSYSWSPALDDERALLLNWQDAFAVLPINSWEANIGNNLQIISFSDDKLKDVGLLPTSTEIQRSLMLDSNVLAGLSNQSLITLRWGVDKKPEILAELELATNLTWLKLQNEKLWSASMGNRGYHRLHQYNTSNLEAPEQSWLLPKNYNDLMMDEDMVVFYNNYEPLEVQVFDKKTEQLFAPQLLELSEKTDNKQEKRSALIDDTIWYDRRPPLLHNGWFYLAEQRSFKHNPNMILPLPEQDYWQSQWILRSWNLQANKPVESTTRSIPGWPLAITESGNLITQEMNEDRQQRLNLLTLKTNNAVLLDSYNLSCDGYVSFMWATNTLYASCQNEPNFINEPMIELENPILVKTIFDETSSTGEEISEKATTKVSEKTASDDIEEFSPITKITQLNPTDKGFIEVGSWNLPGQVNLQFATDGVVLVNTNNYWGYAPMEKSSILPQQELGCNVYQLTPEQEPILLKHLETCLYNNNAVALTSEQIWRAEGYAGIKNTKF